MSIPKVTFVLNYVAVLAKYDGISGNEPVIVEGEVTFKAPIDQYGRAAMYAKDEKIVFNQLKAKDSSYKGLLRLAKTDLKMYGDWDQIQEFIDEPIRDNETWFKSLGKKPELKDRLEYEANIVMNKKQGELLEELYVGPESELKDAKVIEVKQVDPAPKATQKKVTKKKAASKPKALTSPAQTEDDLD
jgi:hypothetical protein